MSAIIELQALNKTFGSGENQVNALQNVSISSRIAARFCSMDRI